MDYPSNKVPELNDKVRLNLIIKWNNFYSTERFVYSWGWVEMRFFYINSKSDSALQP